MAADDQAAASTLRPVVMADSATPADAGPYFVGYGDEWRGFAEWDDAWEHHVMRGSTIGQSHIKVRAEASRICECGHNFSRHGTGSGCWDCECKENRETGGDGPSLDPDSMPPEELARLRAEGFGHMIGESRMDDSPGYRRDW